MRLTILIVTLVAFAVFSHIVVADLSYFGFIELARREPWGLQVLVDLCIALTLFGSWMIGDARRRQIPFWPYLLAIAALGSMGALAYLIHREVRRIRPYVAAAAPSM